VWNEEALAQLHRDFGEFYDGRTVLVTGADGFMGSHLTDALVVLGAKVHAFVRATSSGALNNIGHLRDQLKVHFADLTDKTVDRLPDPRAARGARPTVRLSPRRAGARTRVLAPAVRDRDGEHVGTLNLLQSIVDNGLELEKFDTAGTSEEYGNVHEAVAHHHDFDDDGGLILHERSPINPKSIYAHGKGRRGLPHDELPRRVRPARRRHADVQQLRAAPEPALRDGHDHHAGAGARVDRARRARAAARLLLLYRRRPRPSDRGGEGRSRRLYVYGQGQNISMRDWAELILRVGREQGHWGDREIVTTPLRVRPGSSEVMALRVGYEKLNRETRWEPLVSWEEGVAGTIAWYAENRDRWIGRVDWLSTGRPTVAAQTQR
jgi:dTDP-glucose 4,6-dehydratase